MVNVAVYCILHFFYYLLKVSNADKVKLCQHLFHCIKESFYSLDFTSDIFYITKMGLSDTNRHSVCLQIKYQYLMSRNLCNITTQNITLFRPIFPLLSSAAVYALLTL